MFQVICFGSWWSFELGQEGMRAVGPGGIMANMPLSTLLTHLSGLYLLHFKNLRWQTKTALHAFQISLNELNVSKSL